MSAQYFTEVSVVYLDEKQLTMQQGESFSLLYEIYEIKNKYSSRESCDMCKQIILK